MEMNITPTDAVDAPQAAPLAPAEHVLMVRAPGGAPGVRKALVAAAEVDNYLKAGWHKA